MVQSNGLGPRAIVVSGPAGCGKTTFARRLATVLGSAVLDLDDVTDALTEMLLLHFGSQADLDASEGGQWSTSLRNARYSCLLSTAAANLAVGCRVIVVAPFTQERNSVSKWEKVVNQLHACRRSSGSEGVALCYLDCPPDLLLERLVHRGASRDTRKFDNPERIRAASVQGRPVVSHIKIDAARAVDDQVREALMELGFYSNGGNSGLMGTQLC